MAKIDGEIGFPAEKGETFSTVNIASIDTSSRYNYSNS